MTVTAKAPGSGTPTGTVQFKVDGSNRGSAVTLDDTGSANSNPINNLTVGTHTITATYSGDSSFLTTQATGFKQTVQKDSTTTSLVSSANPSVHGQSVTFTATVSANAPGGGTPTGSVTFKDGSTTLGTATLSAGVGTLTTSNLSTATHSITAVYGGSTSFVTSTSTALSQEVDQAPTSTAVTSSINPTVSGQSVTFTATVSVPRRAAARPRGRSPSTTAIPAWHPYPQFEQQGDARDHHAGRGNAHNHGCLQR